MRDRNHRPSFGHALQIGIDDGFALRVERAGGLVEDQHRRIDQQRSRNGNPLPLATGQVGRPLLQDRVVAARQAFDKLFGARKLGCVHDIGKARVRTRHRDVVANRAGKQKVFLRHHTDIGAQMHQVYLAQVHAVNFDHAFITRMQALQQTSDRGLARAAASHDPQHRAARNGERHLIQCVRRAGDITKAYVFEGDFAFDGHFQPIELSDFRGHIHNGGKLEYRSAYLSEVLLKRCDANQRGGKTHRQDGEGHQCSRADGNSRHRGNNGSV